MGSQLLETLMKSFFSKYRQNFFRPGFFQGAVMAIGFTSLVSIAATNFPGYFVFSSGTPISSSEINSNFEKLTGSILLKAVISDNVSVNQSSFIIPSACPTCHNFSKKLTLSSVSVGTANVLTSTDTDSESSSYGSNFNYISIPSDGWYEFRLITNVTTSLSGTNCDSTNCNANVNANSAIYLATSLANAQAHSQGSSMSWVSAYDNLNDANSDGMFDVSNNIYGVQPPEIKRYYLKAGQILFFGFNASYNQNLSTISASVSFSNMDITIIKL